MAIQNIKVYENGDKLTKKQLLWIEEYIKCDDYTTASRNAGYKGNKSTLKCMGYQNSLKFKKIIDSRREELNKEVKADTIAELEDIFIMWSEVMKDEDTHIKSRLKASELLAKAKGAFVEKVEVKEIQSEWFK